MERRCRRMTGAVSRRSPRSGPLEQPSRSSSCGAGMWDANPMRRIGHRGAKGHAPDNTIESFEKAVALGCDEVETDVWLADDGRLLITHDRPGPDTKLTLEEVLDFCRGKMGVNVELKSEMSERSAQETGGRVGKMLAERRDPAAYVSRFWGAALEGGPVGGPPGPSAVPFAG